MTKKRTTAAERRHMEAVAGLGCIACLLDGNAGTPAEIHHPRAGAGLGQRAPHSDGIPLCSHHHRGTDHPRTPSIHMDKHAFIARYGSEADLLNLTRDYLARRAA